MQDVQLGGGLEFTRQWTLYLRRTNLRGRQQTWTAVGVLGREEAARYARVIKGRDERANTRMQPTPRAGLRPRLKVED